MTVEKNSVSWIICDYSWRKENISWIFKNGKDLNRKKRNFTINAILK